ncbi:Acb2/Tad1 domain-containing protein [Psychrobacter sp. T6-1]|uniref:Acb2/Tad1 domain-containing protein n=1 Tax=Psychrobacter sp. T6-1 TaxID=3457447 RepID=UPI003FD1DBEC
MSDEKPKITGYRVLTQAEIDLMNKVKAKGAELGELIQELKATDGLDQRWIATGATDIQKGLMAVTRGIAQPNSF